MTTTHAKIDYDTFWKEALEVYFQDFMAFFFTEAHQDIDWEQPHEFLDKELQQIVQKGETGRRLVDKLVKVQQKNGEERWVLVHIEVQGSKATDFARRMYIYNHRLFDRFKHYIVSLAILTDTNTDWRPNQFGYKLWGYETQVKFPIVKLIDYERERKWAELEASQNPFAVLVMTHLKTMATQGDDKDRYKWKVHLARNLYRRGYERRDIINLFWFIDWLMMLPPAMGTKFDEVMREYEETHEMRYITSIERRLEEELQQGLQQGHQEGLAEGIQHIQQGIVNILEVRFGGPLTEATVSQLDELQDIVKLKLFLKEAAIAPSLADFEAILAKETHQDA